VQHGFFSTLNCFRLPAICRRARLVYGHPGPLTSDTIDTSHLNHTSNEPAAERSEQAGAVSLPSLADAPPVDPSLEDTCQPQRQPGAMWRMASPRLQRYVRLALAFWSGRFVWVAPSSQVTLGLLLLYLVIWLTLPQLQGWWLALVPVVFGLGVLGAIGITRQVGVTWSESGGSISVTGLARGVLMLVPVIFLRFVVRVLVDGGMTSLLPLRDLLFFFVPGMLTTRGLVLLIRLYLLRRDHLQQKRRSSTTASSDEC